MERERDIGGKICGEREMGTVMERDREGERRRDEQKAGRREGGRGDSCVGTWGCRRAVAGQ